jgi:hypothetical protein
MTTQSVSVVADNTRIDPSGTSLLLLTSDNTTATNRTIILNASTLVGHKLHIVLVSGGSTAVDLPNSGTCKLSGAWQPASQYQTLTLISDGTYWLEEARSSTITAATSVTLAMLASGITPSHVVKFAGKYTTAGGSATEAQTLAGVLTSDVVLATLQDKGATPRTLLTTKPTAADTITYVFSGDPSTDHVVSYQVLRAAT